jgi:tetratricopeptide (TPR) repeat protein
LATRKQKSKRGSNAGQVRLSAHEQTLLGQARTQHDAGNAPAAEQLYRELLRINRANPIALHFYGVLNYQMGLSEAALELMDEAVKHAPRDPSVKSNRGEVLRSMGRYEEALSAYRDATRLAPEYMDAWNNLALVLASLDRLGEAEHAARKVIKLAPQALEGHMVLAQVRWARADYAGCATACEAALAVDSQCAEAAFKMGLCSSELGQPEDARRWFESALALAPNAVEARLALVDLDLAQGDLGAAWERIGYLNDAADIPIQVSARLGQICYEIERFHDAVVHLGHVVEQEPDDWDAQVQLSWAMAQSGALAEATERLEQVVQQSGVAAHYVSLGRLLALHDRTDAALSNFHQALDLDSLVPDAHRGIADMLVARGDFDAARDALEAAIGLNSNDAYAFESLAQITKKDVWPQDRLAQLESLGADPSLSASERAAALFAAGKLSDGSGEYTQAFDYMARANQAMCEVVQYAPEEHARLADRITASFQSFTPSDVPPGENDVRPIFIVGMPRSGTSLVEQIIASHPQAAGAGEVEFFSHIRFSQGYEYPEGCAELDSDAIADLRTQYLEKLVQSVSGTAPEKRCDLVTDKMPSNFLYLGLIHLLFPNARFIHCRRDLMDVGVSNYFQNFTFAIGNAYSFDLRSIGHYMLTYQRMMAHWKALLPGQILDVDYETLVQHPRESVQNMLAHVGLEWDEACLQFHASDREVRTASSFQVRQPLYTSAVKRWEHYREELAPLREALEGE